MSDLPRTSRPTATAAAVEYFPLQKFLKARFADSVVLTLTQIEDLLGVPLPEVARREPDWWANPTSSVPLSAQARSWTEADRTANPNLRAATVRFDRNTS